MRYLSCTLLKQLLNHLQSSDEVALIVPQKPVPVHVASVANFDGAIPSCSGEQQKKKKHAEAIF